MSNVLDQLGIHKEEKTDFPQLLFYFMREFKLNPFDEEYIIDGKRIIKKGMPIPLFNALVEEMQKHYEKEVAQYKKISRKR